MGGGDTIHSVGLDRGRLQGVTKEFLDCVSRARDRYLCGKARNRTRGAQIGENLAAVLDCKGYLAGSTCTTREGDHCITGQDVDVIARAKIMSILAAIKMRRDRNFNPLIGISMLGAAWLVLFARQNADREADAI